MATWLFVRGSTRFPAAEQYKSAEKYGKHGALDVSKGDSVEDLIKVVRKGDRVLLWGVGRLEVTWRGFRVAINKLWKKGVTVVDMRVDVAIEAPALEAITQAHAEIIGQARMPGRAPKIRGKKGGLQRSALGHTDKSFEECRAIWFDHKKYDTDDDAAYEAGVAKRTLYNWFGRSCRRAGKRPK